MAGDLSVGMDRVEANMFDILQVFLVSLSVPVISVRIWLATRTRADCLIFLHWPFIVLGVLLILIWLAGFLGSCRRIVWLLLVYVCLLTTIIVMLLSFSIFALGVANEVGNGQVVSGARKEVDQASNWGRIEHCLANGQLCNDLNKRYPDLSDFHGANLSPVQSGCCKPPTACNFTFVNPTNWANATNPGASIDCMRWSNDGAKMCFACDSCRAGEMRSVRQHWVQVAMLNLEALLLLFPLYTTGWLVLMNHLHS